ncbi:MAG: PEP-CTERM sorting domain-containing protein [Acidobacteriota bacterium]
MSDLTGSSGCALAPFSIFNASFTPAPGSPATAADDIGVSIGYDGNSIGISFNGLFLFPADTSDPPGYAEYFIRYTIDPPPPVILGFDMDMDFGGDQFRFAGPSLFSILAGPPIVEVFTELCVGGDFARLVGCTGVPYGPIILDPTNTLDGVRFAGSTNWVSVIHRIRVTQDIDLNLNNRAPLDSTVPEPGTWAMMGSGILLLAMGWRRRR